MILNDRFYEAHSRCGNAFYTINNGIASLMLYLQCVKLVSLEAMPLC